MNPFDLGGWKNWYQVFGTNPWIWFLPVGQVSHRPRMSASARCIRLRPAATLEAAGGGLSSPRDASAEPPPGARAGLPGGRARMLTRGRHGGQAAGDGVHWETNDSLSMQPQA